MIYGTYRECGFTIAVAFLLQALAPAALAAVYLNVATDTPLGEFEPRSDLAAAVQWAIDHQHEFSFHPVIPAGSWDISTPLRIPNRKGGTLAGMGRGENNTAGAGNVTTLHYTGPSDQPMLTYQGDNWQIKDLCLAGRRKYQQEAGHPRGKVGILSTTIKRRGDPHYQHTGTTKLRLVNVAFYGWETAFQNGSDLQTTNSDLHVLSDVLFADCTIGFHNRHLMGMEIAFHRLKVPNSVDVAVRFDAGGTARFTDCNLSGSGSNAKFLMLSGRRVGMASGGFWIDGLKIDGSIDGTTDLEVVHMTEPAATDVVIQNLRSSNPRFVGRGGRLATLRGDVTLTVRDSYRPGRIECHSTTYGPNRRVLRPHVLVDNCRLAGGEVQIAGPHSLVVRDCLEWGRSVDGPSPTPALMEVKAPR